MPSTRHQLMQAVAEIDQATAAMEGNTNSNTTNTTGNENVTADVNNNNNNIEFQEPNPVTIPENTQNTDNVISEKNSTSEENPDLNLIEKNSTIENIPETPNTQEKNSAGEKISTTPSTRSSKKARTEVTQGKNSVTEKIPATPPKKSNRKATSKAIQEKDSTNKSSKKSNKSGEKTTTKKTTATSNQRNRTPTSANKVTAKKKTDTEKIPEDDQTILLDTIDAANPLSDKDVRDMWDKLPSDVPDTEITEVAIKSRKELNEEHFSVSRTVVPWIALVTFVCETTNCVFVSPKVNHRMMDKSFARVVLVDSSKKAAKADWSEEITICFWMYKICNDDEDTTGYEPLYSSYKHRGSSGQMKIKNAYAAPVTIGAFKNMIELLKIQTSFSDFLQEYDTTNDDKPIVDALLFQKLLDSPAFQKMTYPIKDLFSKNTDLEQLDVINQPLTINLVTRSIRVSSVRFHSKCPIYIGIIDGQHRGLVANCLGKGYNIPEVGSQDINKDFHFRSLGDDSVLNSTVKVEIIVPKDGKFEGSYFRTESERLNIRKHEGLCDTYRSRLFALLTEINEKSDQQNQKRFWHDTYLTTEKVKRILKKKH